METFDSTARARETSFVDGLSDPFYHAHFSVFRITEGPNPRQCRHFRVSLGWVSMAGPNPLAIGLIMGLARPTGPLSIAPPARPPSGEVHSGGFRKNGRYIEGCFWLLWLLFVCVFPVRFCLLCLVGAFFID